MRAQKAPKPYPEAQKDGSIKWVSKSREEYNGTKWICTGSSRTSPAEMGKREAKQRWQQNYMDRVAQIEGGRDRKAGRMKLNKAMPEWYDLYMRNKTTNGRPRSAQTIETDRVTQKMILDALGDYNVCDIDADILQRYFNMLVEAGTGASMLRKCWIQLNQFFAKYAPRNNPLVLCQKPQSQQIAAKFAVDDDNIVTKKAYTNAHMETLTAMLLKKAAGRNREQAAERGRMLVVIMWQFLRLAEAAELRVRDIDFATNKIYVQRQYDELHRIVTFPKDNSKREMPISKYCVALLETACEGKKPEDLVFCGSSNNGHGGRVLRGALRDTLTAACAAAGIERHHVHDLRHDGISYLVRQGVRPRSIQKWAGHSSLTVTLDIYYRDCGDDDPSDVALMTGAAQTSENVDINELLPMKQGA